MIRKLINYALENRLMILALAVLLLLWGAVSFHNLPVEAYPDVANNYVQIITQWPGRAAEEVEQPGDHSHRDSDERDSTSPAFAVGVTV